MGIFQCSNKMPKRKFTCKIVQFVVEKDLEKLKNSVSENPEEVDKIDKDGNSILHIAGEISNNVGILEYLLQIMGSEFLEKRNKRGQTPFMLASGVTANRENVRTLYINHICSREKEKNKE